MVLVTVLLGVIFALMLLGVPIGFAILAGGTLTIATMMPHASLVVVPQQIFSGIDSFSLLAIPCFLLAGALMSAGGITTRLLDLANAILGRFRGGLAMSNVLSATIFAGISGSAVADTSALGRILIPAMIQAGYKPGFTAALTASANVLAPIIPPSIAFIVVGVLTGQSITRLFIAGIFVGLIYSAALIAVIAWLARTHDFPIYGKTPLREIGRIFVRALAAIMMPVLIVGGIRTGIFNVTEVAAVTVLYALFVGFVVYRELTWRKVYDSLVSSAHITAVIMIIVGAARIFSWLLGYTGLPDQIARTLLSVTENPLLFLLLINVLMLIVGMFVEANAALIMLLPVLYPVALKLGIDPLHFSTVMVVNLCIGLITPPVGLTLNLSALMAGIKLEEAVRFIWPFLASGFFVLALLTYVPGIATWLPNLLMN